MQSIRVEDVLRFWFPDEIGSDLTLLIRRWEWWFRGGGDAEITAHFSSLVEQAARGELDTWAYQPQSRLALIIVLDQFSRTIYRGTAQAFAQDAKACTLALDGIEIGHYARLKTSWEKTFFMLPLGHSEDLRNLEMAIALADDLAQEASPDHRPLLEFSAAQARRHREVLVKFGRHPHRNEALGRPSTPAEQEYLRDGQLVHRHPMPPHLAQWLPQSSSTT
jgi:uncharacterized protein (DUF924 family)